MSSNLYKAYRISVKEGQTRVIDCNAQIAKKLEALEPVKTAAEEIYADYAENDDFHEGVEADDVEALVSDENAPEILQAARKRAEQDAESIRLRAGQQLEEAKAQAQKIVEEAAAQAESLRQEAAAQGKVEGYEAGYADGKRQADQLSSQLREQQKALEQSYQEKIEQLEPLFIENLTGIYERVFETDLSGERNIVTTLLRKTMLTIENSKTYLIHIAKEDYPYVSMKKKEILETVMSSGASVEMIEDVMLSAGQCMIETDGGIYDCSVGTELKGLSAKLRLLSYEKE